MVEAGMREGEEVGQRCSASIPSSRHVARERRVPNGVIRSEGSRSGTGILIELREHHPIIGWC